MLVIFASRFDREAQALAERWSTYDATLLTAEDLSVAGWRFYTDKTKPSTAVIGGRTVTEADIVGVLTRWPAIHEAEISKVHPDDRVYVASEMTAFVRSWLAHLKCPILNRPTATTFIGPAWRPERWVHVGAQLGIPVHPVHRRTDMSMNTLQESTKFPSTVVTVVGDQCFGTSDLVIKQQARLLAAAAGVDLLGVHFDGSERGASLLTADLLPSLSDTEVVDAVLAYLLRDSMSLSSN